MNAKSCRQCGEIKLLSQFRQYYGGRTGHYTICKSCEKINSRLKYLDSKESLTDVERIERDKIIKLYEAQQAAGLRPPRRSGRSTELMADLDEMIKKYQPVAPSEVPELVTGPAELTRWLTCELTEDPDVYINDVYEALCETYSPVLSIDRTTMIPVRDEKFKHILDAILKRFYEYEDKYYES